MPQKDYDVRAKLQRLADETGGRSFFIAAASELERVFATVEEELRSQYMLAYQSTNQSRDDKFRVRRGQALPAGAGGEDGAGVLPVGQVSPRPKTLTPPAPSPTRTPARPGEGEPSSLLAQAFGRRRPLPGGRECGWERVGVRVLGGRESSSSARQGSTP